MGSSSDHPEDASDYSGVVKIGHHQYWLRDEVEPNVDTLGENSDPGPSPLVAIDESRRMASIYTGMYGFDLPLTIQVRKSRPEPVLDDWDEAIEFSLLLKPGAHVESILNEDGLDFDLPAPGSYRIRLHAVGRQQGEERQHISIDHGDDPVEKHMLQIWPAPSAPLQWLKEHPRPTWEPDPDQPRTDFYVETSNSQYWISDHTTGRQAANVTGRGNGVILPEPDGHMAAIFTGEPASIVEVQKDILAAAPDLELDDWEEVAEVSMVFTGPDFGCNFLNESAPPGYEYLPAEDGQSRTYRVRVSVKGRHTPHELADRPPNTPRHAERHLIQIWPAPQAPEKIWKAPSAETR
ncbi:hypothetical protein [Actinomadura oligospora]|uniref:hypothetical protein n=1 Tax=Actinomadura oligospora TaxID=111804 RepID=UPI0004B6CA05|nr:hypothetical protein [Actinomadura oligospora]